MNEVSQYSKTEFLSVIDFFTLYTHYGIEPILGSKFLTCLRFPLITLNHHNPQFLITLCIKMRYETLHCLTTKWFALVLRKKILYIWF